ncbi:MAG: glycine oxidase ThiO [Zetaproteobacteria bacterium]|nr:MAG: glycine oxidase ThiO [Zetaproteobacteria bacterium]
MRVVVIGGGIIGALCAWRLHQRGARVSVLERGTMGHEASWAGAGILCPIHPWLYPDAFTHLVNASLRVYPDFVAELQRETGVDVQWRKCGLLIPEFPWDEQHHHAAAMAWSERFGWDVEELDEKQVRSHEPALACDVQGGLLWPQVAQVRNPRLLRAVRKALVKCGVSLIEHADVMAVEADGDGTRRVRTADGRRFEADVVLLAAGSWSGELAEQLGFSLPVEPVKGQIVLLHGRPGNMQHIVKHDRAYFVPRADGRILVGASMERVGFERGTTRDVIGELVDAIRQIAPGLEGIPIEKAWMGFRPGSPDGLPFLGPVGTMPGVWVASGHYRNGVVLAPITADVISRWIVEGNPGLPMDAFRVDREAVEHAVLGYPQLAS